MKGSWLYKTFAAVILLLVLAAATTFVNSFWFNPDPSGDASFIDRKQQKSANGIRVNISALGARESQQSFGEDLAKHNIQPVWLSIENETDEQLVFLPITMDPNYYSAYEVSYKFHGVLSLAANRARDAFFLRRQMASVLPPHSKTTGFVYGVLDAGVKYAHIVIAGNNRVETFDFALQVPGPAFVGTNIRADSVYPGKKIEDLEFSSIRTVFANLACCTSNSDGQPCYCRKQTRSDRSLYRPWLASREAARCGKCNRNRSRFHFSGRVSDLPR
jgi:hypothetical protein